MYIPCTLNTEAGRSIMTHAIKLEYNTHVILAFLSQLGWKGASFRLAICVYPVHSLVPPAAAAALFPAAFHLPKYRTHCIGRVNPVLKTLSVSVVKQTQKKEESKRAKETQKKRKDNNASYSFPSVQNKRNFRHHI